ncbi:PH domain-containing protein [Candidatus Saccharibacteria bacterium]|nr:MAG: PH domain-containing protein [Candidatus Saccharibacteria bacterium]
MSIDPKLSSRLHHRLPIGDDEEILGVFRHHWFVYISIWVIGLFAIVAIMGSAVAFTTGAEGTGSQYRPVVIAGAALFSFLVALGTVVPAWMKAQEQLVVTDEAALQVLQPSLFGSKISQLSLQHVADVSVRKDFFGTLFGFGTIIIETPGEQANYTFSAVPSPDVAAKVLIEAHENFIAALESGRLPTSIRKNGNEAHGVTIDAGEYQKFLDFQQYQARAAQPENVAPSPDPNEKPA